MPRASFRSFQKLLEDISDTPQDPFVLPDSSALFTLRSNNRFQGDHYRKPRMHGEGDILVWFMGTALFPRMPLDACAIKFFSELRAAPA